MFSGQGGGQHTDTETRNLERGREGATETPETGKGADRGGRGQEVLSEKMRGEQRPKAREGAT